MARVPVARLKALTLDVTNTLVKARRSLGQQYAEAALLHGIRADADVLERSIDTTISQKTKEMPDYGRHNGIVSKDWWSDVVHRVFRTAGHTDVTKETLTKVFETLWQHFLEEPTDAWEVLPNVHEGLALMKSRGLRLGVVSNFDRTLGPTLQALNLTQYFDFTVTSEDTGASKPEPKIFYAGIQSFGGGPLSPGDVGHVGDDLQNDYLGPLKIGMTAFLIDRESHLSSAVMQKVVDQRHIVRDLKDVNQLVAPK